MIGPHLIGLEVGEVAELVFIILIRAAIGQPAGRAIARQIHGQRHIAASGPVICPLVEGLATATVHQQHRGERAVARRRTGVIGKDPRRPRLKWFTLVINLLSQIRPRAKSRPRHGP